MALFTHAQNRVMPKIEASVLIPLSLILQIKWLFQMAIGD